MIYGMTGFGSSQITRGAMKALIEIKSVNHRYLDVTFYLPTGFGAAENKIRQLLQKELTRGRVTVAIKIIEKPGQSVQLNEDVVKQHMAHAQKIQKEFNLKNDLTLSDIIRLPGVLEMREVFVDANEIWPNIERSLRKSLDGLIAMRKSEGRALIKDITGQLKDMAAHLKIIKTTSKSIVSEAKKTMTTDEFTSFRKGCDVNEEMARLSHYIDEVKKLLSTGEHAGKKIDFIAQEMQRETNTIGSKMQDKVVSNSVISLKGKIEKIREQSQNIE